MKNNLFPIAKEGWRYIGYSVLAFVFFSILDLDLFEFAAFVLVIFFLFIFRNPERELPRFEPLSVVSPVDGTVMAIDEIKGTDYAYKVTIDSSYFDVSILRAPISGSVKSVDKFSGATLGLDTSLSEKINENSTIVFEDSSANLVKISHMSKQSFDGINLYLHESQNIFQSSRYGVMINGVTTIYLPQNFRLNITVGNEIKACESLVGYFS